MAISPEFSEFVEYLFRPVAPVRIRRMFGGAGVFLDHGAEQIMFALIISEVIYLKVDDATRGEFEAEGKGPFTYEAKGKSRALGSYYEIPERLLDEPEEMVPWARKAIDVALRNHKPKATKTKSKAKAKPRTSRKKSASGQSA